MFRSAIVLLLTATAIAQVQQATPEQVAAARAAYKKQVESTKILSPAELAVLNTKLATTTDPDDLMKAYNDLGMQKKLYWEQANKSPAFQTLMQIQTMQQQLETKYADTMAGAKVGKEIQYHDVAKMSLERSRRATYKNGVDPTRPEKLENGMVLITNPPLVPSTDKPQVAIIKNTK